MTSWDAPWIEVAPASWATTMALVLAREGVHAGVEFPPMSALRDPDGNGLPVTGG